MSSAQHSASVALANSTRNPSPVVFTRRPPYASIFGCPTTSPPGPAASPRTFASVWLRLRALGERPSVGRPLARVDRQLGVESSLVGRPRFAAGEIGGQVRILVENAR